MENSMNPAKKTTRRKRAGKRVQRAIMAAALKHDLVVPPPTLSSDPLNLAQFETEGARFLSAKERARRGSSAKRMSTNFCPVGRPWQVTCCTRLALPFVLELPVVQGEALTAPVKIQDVLSDGNCFFRCVSMIICGVETYHPVVRAKLCDFMTSNAEVASSIGENLAEYNKKFDESGMENLGVWATARELFGAAMWLHCDVYTYTLNKWKRYSRTGSNLDAASSPSIFLNHFNKNHYQVVLSVV